MKKLRNYWPGRFFWVINKSVLLVNEYRLTEYTHYLQVSFDKEQINRTGQIKDLTLYSFVSYESLKNWTRQLKNIIWLIVNV